MPVVFPSNTPDTISTSSASRRCDVYRLLPVARRSRSVRNASGAIDNPGGHPSMTQPIAGPWLSPKVVTVKSFPNELLDT